MARRRRSSEARRRSRQPKRRRAGLRAGGQPYTGNGDSVSVGGTAAGTLATKDVGTQNVTITGNSVTGTGSGNYTVTQQTGLTQAVTAKALSVTGITANDKVYDATTTATLSGTAALLSAEAPGSGTTSDGKPYTGDTVTVGGTPAGTFASANVANGIAVMVTGNTLGGTQAGDYSLAQQTGLTANITKANTTSAVSSSTNPSLPGSSVTFTNILSVVWPGGGTPTGAIQFRTNGVAVGVPVALSGGAAQFTTALLPHGSNSVTAEYVGDGNFFGHTNSLSPNQVVNTPPVSGAHMLATMKNQAASITCSKLLARDSDPDGDALHVPSVAGSSAHSGTIVLSSGVVTYTPPTNYAGADSFTYSVSDTFGGATNATVNVTVRGQDVSVTISNLTTLPDGNMQIQSSGIPGQIYLLQASTNLSAWTTIGTNTADTYGVILLQDLEATNYASRFYRTAAP